MAEPLGIGDYLGLDDLPGCDLKAERPGQAPTGREHKSSRAVHERRLHEPCKPREGDRALRPGTRTTNLCWRARRYASGVGANNRMNNPAMIFPDAMKALLALNTVTEKSVLPATTIGLVQLRASQINGCSVCVDMHPRLMKKTGETDERLFAVAAWRDAPYFSDAERAALALTEAVTRLSDRADPVPDEIWNEAARHYDEQALGALVLAIALINVWNRLNVATRQVAGEWVKSADAQAWLASR